MKTKELMIAALITMTYMDLTKAFAFSESKGGGGGDASEAKVNEIRADILSWINAGGSAGLRFPTGMSKAEYNEKMSQYLQPKYVGITFVSKDSDKDEELRVQVDGKPKTCRSFFSAEGGRPSILCNIERFKAITESEQYRLIHHEYAGLAYLEKNDGSSSDYFISNQLSDYLEVVKVLKLGAKKKKNALNLFVEGTNVESESDNILTVNTDTIITKGNISGRLNRHCSLVLHKPLDYKVLIKAGKYQEVRVTSMVEHFQGGDMGVAEFYLDHKTIKSLRCVSDSIRLSDRKTPSGRMVLSWLGDEISVTESVPQVLN